MPLYLGDITALITLPVNLPVFFRDVQARNPPPHHHKRHLWVAGHANYKVFLYLHIRHLQGDPGDPAIQKVEGKCEIWAKTWAVSLCIISDFLAIYFTKNYPKIFHSDASYLFIITYVMHIFYKRVIVEASYGWRHSKEYVISVCVCVCACLQKYGAGWNVGLHGNPKIKKKTIYSTEIAGTLHLTNISLSNLGKFGKPSSSKSWIGRGYVIVPWRVPTFTSLCLFGLMVLWNVWSPLTQATNKKFQPMPFIHGKSLLNPQW